jgi:tetratricopeptide (TPR) repeat protein
MKFSPRSISTAKNMKLLSSVTSGRAAYFGLADANCHLGRWSEALDWTAKGLSIDPAHCGMLRTRANALAVAGRADEARRAVAEFLRLDPNSAASQVAAGCTLRLLGETDEAIEHFYKSLHLDPASSETHRVLGLARLDQERTAEAKHHLQQAVELDPASKSAARIEKDRNQATSRASAGIAGTTAISRRRTGLPKDYRNRSRGQPGVLDARKHVA